ncbi:hypothetical protein E1091_00320 [Micromonospora fluostatini]|uniref:Uncharacterized protein n=1 Tax=Micromonospora fluostatini TaxID=1629071 RepID=A0ABY2DMB0_9ACTN|nr:hypothetical protein E1091_00320 [Micromonospora fluostatini]
MEGASQEQQDEARREVDRLAGEAAPLEVAYQQRRWPRWWFVPGGHLHREGQCSTLYQSTQRNLAPKASGLDDAGVVELYGWHVCTVCVPDAPVLEGFRSPGSEAQAEADASGDCLNTLPKTVNRRYHTPFGECGECGATGVAVTSRGNLRKHKHQRRADDAARVARIEDPKLIGTPTGEELRVGGDTLRTLRTAEIKYVDELVLAGSSEARPDSNPTFISERRANAAVIAEALAAKFKCSVDEITERYAARVAKKLREYA